MTLAPLAIVGERPLAVDLCAGLCGWGEGLISEGWRVRAYDIEDMFAALGEPRPEHVELIVRNVLEMHGSEIADADLIVASPPCTEYSYMAMPWKRAKQIARALRGEDEFPEPYRGSRTVEQLNAIFDACFRLQREASEAAGRDIPMVVENVRGAQPWVGSAKWSFGSFYLWGDVPAMMPLFDGRRKGFAGFKGFKDFHDCEAAQKWSSRDPRRKQWSASIAKIPLALSQHIARVYKPESQAEAA